MKQKDPPIIITELFDNPLEDVWQAISDIKDMKKWYFAELSEFKAEVGFQTSFVTRFEDLIFTHNWEITEVAIFKYLKYTWNYLEYQGNSTVSFELKEIDNQTQLEVQTVILKDFPQNMIEFQRKSCEEGWNYFIKKRLKNYLRNNIF